MKLSTEEIETNLLGAYIENEDLFHKCEHLVTPKLWSGVHKLAFKAICQLRGSGIKVDAILIARELKKLGIKNIPTYKATANYKIQPEQYVQALFENNVARYIQPKLADISSKLEKGEGSVLDYLTTIKSAINDVDLVLNNVSKEKPISQIVDKAVNEIMEAADSKEPIKYTSTITRVDRMTGGLLPGIIVIGAYPGMGKTSLIINIIKHNAIDKNLPIVFFSLEMSATQIVKNLFSNILELDTMKVRDGMLDDEQKAKIIIAKKLFKDNITIDDTPGITWQYIDSKLTQIRKRIPLKEQITVVIDYIQLMGNTDDEYRGKSDEAQMAARCKGLMNLWKKHNCCIIELSQLSRASKDKPRKPVMSDLKESGAIEANANSVWLLNCPDYYDKMPTDDKGNDLRGLMEVIIAKNRGGKTTFAYAEFLKQYSKIIDWKKTKTTTDIF